MTYDNKYTTCIRCAILGLDAKTEAATKFAYFPTIHRRKINVKREFTVFLKYYYFRRITFNEILKCSFTSYTLLYHEAIVDELEMAVKGCN